MGMGTQPANQGTRSRASCSKELARKTPWERGRPARSSASCQRAGELPAKGRARRPRSQEGAFGRSVQFCLRPPQFSQDEIAITAYDARAS